TPEAPAGETPTPPDAPSSTEPPEVIEGTTPPAEAAAETTDAAATAEAPPAESSSNMGTIIGVIAFLVVAAGAGYWFMNRKA
ncbi:MAG: hypothetical protein JNL06_11705, partial [Alphaproteobacteria bacterium]|nr:hypothetical protein [Alphaproteobacteria bacterium]